ncbi:MAG: PilZ domain-containing protein [Candidatus Sedimenticola sp. 20ELBAFRAG]
MNEQYSEHRASQRKAVQERITVIDINSGEEIGHLANISLGGFLLITDQHLSLNNLFQLRLLLPNAINGIDSIDLGAESLWCQATTVADTNWVGFHIIDISDENMQIIEELIDSWKA